MSATNDNDRQAPPPASDGSAAQLDSRMLFRFSNKVEIAHRGETYRLQLTRQGKLLLTK